jgi:AcrR family transcriptional regulator
VSAPSTRTRPAESDDPMRDRLIRAMVTLSGTHGYQATTIDALCGVADVDVSEFESRFADKEDCYVAAHDEIAVEYGERVFIAYDSQAAWHDSMWAAAWAALEYLREDPVRARFFVVEVSGAGPRARARGDGVMQIVASLVDAGRAEVEDGGFLSRATAEVMAGTFYSTIRQKIVEGKLERGEDFVVELMYVAVLPYLGVDAAEAELRVQPLH